MANKPRKGAKAKKAIIGLSVLLVVILVIAALIPWMSSEIQKTTMDRDWVAGKNLPIAGDIVNLENGAGNLSNAEPNYEINTTHDESHTISDASYLDYHIKNTKTKWGQTYGPDTSNGFVIKVTDDNNTPVPSVTIKLTAYGKKTPCAPSVLGALVGAVIGMGLGLAVGGPIGAVIGGVIGLCVGLGIVWWIGADRIDLYNNQVITCDQGTNGNEFLSGDFGGTYRALGGYDDVHVYIELTDETLNSWSPFAVTQEISVSQNAYNVIYIRLCNGNQKLLELGAEIRNSSAFTTMKTVKTFDSQGDLDGNYQGAGDRFRALDTCNLTGTLKNYYWPKVSKYDNDCYKFVETRLIQTKNLAGFTDYQAYYLLWGYDPLYEQSPETYAGAIGYYDLNNESVTTLSSNTYYNVKIEFNAITEGPGYTFTFMIGYNSWADIELLGTTTATWENERHTVELKYEWNNYYGENQTVHREIFDLNDRTQMVCDINTPLYLDEDGAAYFTVRYMLISGNLPLVGDGLFDFNIYLTVYDHNDSWLIGSQDVQIGYNVIGTASFDFTVNGTGLKTLTSYCMSIDCNSMEPTGESTYHPSALYVNALYYLFENYLGFRLDISDLQELIDALIASTTGLSDTVYTVIDDIIGVMHTKINELESNAKDLKGYYPNTGVSYYNKVIDSIEGFKFYYVMLQNYKTTNKPFDVGRSSTLYTDLIDYLTRLNFWYADSFSQYNCYIASIKGEEQIAHDYQNMSGAVRNHYIDELMQDRIKNIGMSMPLLIVAFALVLGAILAGIFNFIFRNTKSKYLLYGATIGVFAISFYIIYLVLNQAGFAFLEWFYGG